MEKDHSKENSVELISHHKILKKTTVYRKYLRKGMQATEASRVQLISRKCITIHKSKYKFKKMTSLKIKNICKNCPVCSKFVKNDHLVKFIKKKQCAENV